MPSTAFPKQESAGARCLSWFFRPTFVNDFCLIRFSIVWETPSRRFGEVTQNSTKQADGLDDLNGTFRSNLPRTLDGPSQWGEIQLPEERKPSTKQKKRGEDRKLSPNQLSIARTLRLKNRL
jgi:hypothetical protein